MGCEADVSSSGLLGLASYCNFIPKILLLYSVTTSAITVHAVKTSGIV